MTKQKENPPAETWTPKTAHEIAVGMFHGLPNLLVPARHHLAKLGAAEAKAAHKGVDRALAMVAECAAKMAGVPGPVRAGHWEGDTLVVVETENNRLEADYVYIAPTGPGNRVIEQVNLRHRKNSTCPWVEVTVWDAREWQTPGSEAFEAIIGVIIKIVSGQEIPVTDAAG